MDIAKKDLGGNSQIVLYQPNETISIEVKLDVEYDTVWLTQQQMVELFASSKANISEHISNIFQQGELQPESTVRKFRIVRKEDALMYKKEVYKFATKVFGVNDSYVQSLRNTLPVITISDEAVKEDSFMDIGYYLHDNLVHYKPLNKLAIDVVRYMNL